MIWSIEHATGVTVLAYQTCGSRGEEGTDQSLESQVVEERMILIIEDTSGVTEGTSGVTVQESVEVEERRMLTRARAVEERMTLTIEDATGGIVMEYQIF